MGYNFCVYVAQIRNLQVSCIAHTQAFPFQLPQENLEGVVDFVMHLSPFLLQFESHSNTHHAIDSGPLP